MFTKINRSQVLAVTGWSDNDLSNRSHANQLSLSHGLGLPAETGTYLGSDCFALLLSDALVSIGFTRAVAGQFVRENYQQWWHGLERIEWPDLFSPPEPTAWGLTRTAIDEGHTTPPPPDAEIYLGVAQIADGTFKVVCGTISESVTSLAEMRAGPAYIRQIPLRIVYDATRAAATKAGVDLGAPFTRPQRHPEHREWYAAIEVYRALSAQRAKVRKPPGPARAKNQRRERKRAKAAAT